MAVVDAVAAKHSTPEIARAYLEPLFSDEGQELAAKHWFRPRNPAILAKHADRFPALEQVAIEAAFGGWAAVQKKHFIDGGIFDQIYAPR